MTPASAGPAAPRPASTHAAPTAGAPPAGAPPLRVLHVDAAREWRGGQNQVRLLARELAGRDGVEQGVACGRGSRLAAEARGTGLPVLELPWKAALDPRAVAGLAAGVRGWDVLHAHSSHALQACVLALAASGAASRLVAARRLDYLLRSPGVWRRADLVLAVSVAARGAAVASGVETSRVRVVHDAVDPAEVRPQQPGRLRRAAGAPEGAPLVGAAGALVGHKDHATFLRAAARLARERPDARFVVAGEGPLRPRLEALARELGLGGRVALPGHLPDVKRSLSDLDLFVMSSREEGMGSAALEAMAAGVPVLVTRAGGLADVAGEVLPSVPPEDPAALAREMARLLGDAGLRARVAEAGARRVEAFGVPAMADATLRAYRQATAWAAARREHVRRAARRADRRRAAGRG